jgi:hypothetical protein
MTNKENQKKKVQNQIFKEFTKKCPLKIASFESKEPPEPDILCQLSNGSTLAFELTEAVDNKIPHKDSVIEKAEEFWQEYKNNRLPKNEKERFEHIFSGCSLTLSLSDQATKRMIKKAIPLIFEKYKNSCRSTLGLIKRVGSNLPEGCESIRIEPRDAEPIFRCSSGSLISSSCIKALRDKFGKIYKTNHSIHLLVYNDHHPFFLVQSEIKTYIEQNIDSSPFEKIWFFDRRSGKTEKILYAFPEIND